MDQQSSTILSIVLDTTAGDAPGPDPSSMRNNPRWAPLMFIIKIIGYEYAIIPNNVVLRQLSHEKIFISHETY
jgi:hypothetical protein